MSITPTPWTWVQPKDRDEGLARLVDARDLNVPERERENLCAWAYTEIQQLQVQVCSLYRELAPCCLCHCCLDAPDRHGEILGEWVARAEKAEAQLAAVQLVLKALREQRIVLA